MQIRAVSRQDKTSIMALLKDTQFFRPDEIIIAEEVLDGSFVCGPGGEYRSFVAVENDTVVGWICFGPTACTIGTFDIYWVAVLPDAQNKGVGKKLMAYAAEQIKNCGGRILVIETSGMSRYLPTQKFYEKLGYIKEACIKDFYAAGDDKIIYISRI